MEPARREMLWSWGGLAAGWAAANARVLLGGETFVLKD
jgi:hypothetical protein